ncbi:MAG TPA: tRNA (adenosine(37)-N6)-threonylcarbamoyltransferase complex dimerization subunit type 1 TsaB [Syntrophomonadaceae bacterium]|nr:tRNA (adenosine(37)-N6)-threonylcarbamoyltransferase complex dimerization subunit type 1 TsaB [Syntrophomonadaceae bacterium]
MLLLAIDSATPVAGVALLEDRRLLKEEFSNYKKTHAETLMPMVDRVMRECQCQVSDLDGIAISAGPGSFTGLRIGLATAKGLCLGSGKPLVAVSTLEMLAANIGGIETLVCPILDARRNEVYAAIYMVTAGKPRSIHPPEAMDLETLVERIKDVNTGWEKAHCILVGDALTRYEDYLRGALGEAFLQAPPHLVLPRASALATLAMDKLQEGQTEDPFTLRPLYLRLSEAEVRRKKGECTC